MKVIQVAEYASGGVATYLRNIISYQLKDERIDKVILINSKYKSENFEFTSNKFEHHTFEYKRSMTGIGKLLRLRKLIDNLSPDVVQFNSSFSGIIRMSYFFKKANYKVIYCAHGWSFTQKNASPLKKRGYALIERMATARTDLIINISNYEMFAAIHHGVPELKMKTIHNSISQKQNLRETENPFRNDLRKLLFIGRFDEAKGLDFLLNNLKSVNNKVELVVIGESVLNDSHKQRIKMDNVKFLGWVDNEYIDSYIQYCDAVIIPSIWEGFGLVALEAMKNSKMVISSDTGGLAEIVDDNVTGLKFKAESRKELQAKLAMFSELSDSEITQMGKNGFKKFLQKYNNEKLCNELIESYL